MTVPMLRVWGAALALALAVLAAPRAVSGAWLHLGRDPPDAPVWVVGTSLVGSGLPSRPDDARGLLGDGRAHARLYRGGMKEDEILQLFAIALELGTVETLILEIQPFARSLASDPAETGDGDDRLALRLGRAALDLSRAAGEGLKDLVNAGVGVHHGRGLHLREPDLDRREPVRPEDLAAVYPVTLHDPRREGRLMALLASAHESGMEVLFVAPPVSQTSATYQGEAAVAALDRHVRHLADRLGVPLLLAPGVWPDRFFVDHAHLNRAGRARLVDELQARWAARHGG